MLIERRLERQKENKNGNDVRMMDNYRGRKHEEAELYNKVRRLKTAKLGEKKIIQTKTTTVMTY